MYYGVVSQKGIYYNDGSSCYDLLWLQSDPAANLTFNLTLTESEKEARSRIVLPYTEQ